MKTLTFAYTSKQLGLLEGLAYRIADNAYMMERFGANGAAIELEENHKTICLLFDQLDKSGVPFWVQNAVIAWAENWRRYKSEYLNGYLETRSIKAVPAA